MPVDRPTFSESWYRVADLRPRLRSTVQVYRRFFRGRPWRVVEDPTSNQYARLSEPGYRLIALLDGRRTVADAWRLANEALGDDAPTQGEAIELLGQLWASNLLMADLAPDAQGLFERYRRRRRREIGGYLSNFLFLRIPLLDPDRFLDRWVGVFGRIFTWYGFAAWAALVAVAGWMVVDRADDLVRAASGVLAPSNLPLLYAGLVLVKVVHEFGHAFACKRFGRDAGSGGEVHTMGIMLLVLTPMPYVDASSAWALRSKWRRIAVSSAGMFCELGVAAVAAIVWSRTAEGAAVHALAYNMMFIASVSTLLFNANPLLRYDGYYILSDLLEMPNLADRSRRYIGYLVRRYVWRVRRPLNPAHSTGERFWLAFYAVASTLYRLFVWAAIILFVSSRLPFIGGLLAIGAVVAWIFVPIFKFVRYLATSPELVRVRTWAVTSTVIFVGALAGLVGLVPAPDRGVIEGVVQPEEMALLHVEAPGFVREYLPSGEPAAAGGAPLLRAESAELEASRDGLLARVRELEAQGRLAMTQEPASVQIVAEELAAVGDELAYVERQLASLELRSPIDGTWLSPDVERLSGAYVQPQSAVGMVADLDRLVVRATAGQNVAVRMSVEARPEVRIRIKGRPESEVAGRILSIVPGGKENLPTAALGHTAGGETLVDPSDTKGTRTAEHWFEVRIAPETGAGAARLLPGEVVLVRFETPEKTLAMQAFRAILQLLQRRFQT